MTHTNIIITLQVEGFHNWPEAPKEVDFLRERHRHIFHIQLEKSVAHSDRDVEIILFKREVHAFLAKTYGNVNYVKFEDMQHHIPVGFEMEFGRMSCEQIADVLAERFECERVSVLEDNENGAVVYKSIVAAV